MTDAAGAGQRGAVARRAFDLACALAGLVATGPIWPVIAAAIRIDSPGPILYRAVRVGRGGRPIVVHKFRTMVVDTGATGPAVTAAGDPRITRVGRLLRRSKLDELPQLVDVARGAMSVVGPRPEDPRYVGRYSTEQRALLAHRPGLLSPATIAFRDEETVLAAAGGTEAAYVEVLGQKLALDLDYFDRRSLRRDLRVLVAGLVAIARPGRAAALSAQLR
jgi:lipopolysaccharide/colanic/teichoic acid biosynthesis glycosyltransferase